MNDILLYKKVKLNLKKNGINYREWNMALMEEFASKLSKLNKEKGWNYKLATCAEKIDIEKYGIYHNRCIDGELIAKIAYDDAELMKYMKIQIEDIPEPSLFGDLNLPKGAILLPNNKYCIISHNKASGQRKLCGCMSAKDIGEYNTCAHFCEYCYANSSKESALNNYKRNRLNTNSETITGK